MGGQRRIAALIDKARSTAGLRVVDVGDGGARTFELVEGARWAAGSIAPFSRRGLGV